MPEAAGAPADRRRGADGRDADHRVRPDDRRRQRRVAAPAGRRDRVAPGTPVDYVISDGPEPTPTPTPPPTPTPHRSRRRRRRRRRPPRRRRPGRRTSATYTCLTVEVATTLIDADEFALGVVLGPRRHRPRADDLDRDEAGADARPEGPVREHDHADRGRPGVAGGHLPLAGRASGPLPPRVRVAPQPPAAGDRARPAPGRGRAATRHRRRRRGPAPRASRSQHRDRRDRPTAATITPAATSSSTGTNVRGTPGRVAAQLTGAPRRPGERRGSSGASTGGGAATQQGWTSVSVTTGCGRIEAAQPEARRRRPAGSGGRSRRRW